MARRSRFHRVSGVGVLVLGLGLWLGGAAVAAESAPPRKSGPVIEPARGGQCVEPAPEMRRHHMEYLRHQRDATVHGGVRGAKYSLKACVDCHASPVSQSVVAAPTNFCVSCHSYAAVRIDCFECHSDKPRGAATPVAGSQASRSATPASTTP